MKTINYIFAASLFLFAACGGNDNKPASSGTDTSATSVTNNEASDLVEQTITVTGSSMADMGYDPVSFSVKSGSKVKITLINTHIEQGMVHNWVLVKLGSGQEVANAAIEAGLSKNYVPNNSNVIAASGLAQPKETISFEFIAPAVGSYNYICTFPGHFPKMVGKLVVG